MTDLLKSNPALLIIDMQNGFCHPDGCFGKLGMPVSNHLAIVPAINKVRAACHAASIPVIFTRLCFREDYSDAGVQMEEQPHIKELRGFVSGTCDADILYEFTPDPSQGEIVIDKTRNSAIFNPTLKDLLLSRGVNQLLCTGVGSNVCVESTVRDAVSHDFYCIRNLNWFGGVTTVDEVLGALKHRQASS